MVEAHWAHGVQAFVTPVAENEIDVAMLSSDSHLRYQDALRLFPELVERLAGATATSNVRGAITASRRLATGRRGLAFALAGAPSLATVIWLCVVAPGVVDGDVRTSSVEWIPSLGVDLDLRLDGFAVLMLALVAGIGVLVFAYAWRYFNHPEPADIRLDYGNRRKPIGF